MKGKRDVSSCLHVCLDAVLLPESYQYTNFLEGTDCLGGQLHCNKEHLFSGITSSGRVWREVPESNARSVLNPLQVS